jgi:hypothetical protein
MPINFTCDEEVPHDEPLRRFRLWQTHTAVVTETSKAVSTVNIVLLKLKRSAYTRTATAIATMGTLKNVAAATKL